MVHSPASGFVRAAPSLSKEELLELDAFLLSGDTSDETMTLSTLDGYLSALTVGPATIMPSLWLPRVWGPTEDDAPEFETMEHAERIIGLILRHMNSIGASLERDADSHEPIIGARNDPENGSECPDGEAWAFGFMQGVDLCRADWEVLFNDTAGSEALRPIRLLNDENLSTDERVLIRTVRQRARLSEQLSGSLAAIYRFWLPFRRSKRDTPLVRRAEPKVGRNDLCPCGSGRKFKRCCGAN